MRRDEIIKYIEKQRIIAIIRGIPKEKLNDTVEALYKGGIRLAEITFDQTGKLPYEYTAQCIGEIADLYDGRMIIGAGTVMTEQQVQMAHSAGAQYIISPDTNEDVIKKTVQLGMVSIPGALTPSEAVFAHRCGADFVKLFPAGELGLSYIKAIKAPLSHIKLIAVGGINENNITDFLNCGLGVGIGSGIVRKSYIDSGDFDKIVEVARLYTSGWSGDEAEIDSERK